MARSTRYSDFVSAFERARRSRDDYEMYLHFNDLLNHLSNDSEAPSTQRHVYEKMDNYFRLSVEKCLSEPQLRRLLISMGRMHRMFGNEVKADEYLERWWDFLISRKWLERDPASCLASECRFADTVEEYYEEIAKLKRFDKALKNFDKTIAIFERCNLPRKKDYITLLHLKGLTLHDMEKDEESLKVLKRAFKMMKKTKYLKVLQCWINWRMNFV